MSGISKILIANRGEIALRVLRACKELGIATVAVHSTADANAMHVRLADESVCIGPPPSRDSYLNIHQIVAACEITGADAVHPGYGFLSENAKFADILDAHGITFIGPTAEHIRLMGDKITAKKTAVELGIPVVPGSAGEVKPENALEIAREIGFPVLIKATAGGGGRGMKVAKTEEELEEAVSTARSEALAAFGNDAVYMEKYLGKPRHIEVQIVGDGAGNAIHLGERDCSLQRRHQKVIEEAPAPGMDEATRADLCAAAVRAAKAVDYVGAGTIEFIADASEGLRADRIWFMEMNTRLQVEHPVTEEITGIDLVEWQLRVASGEPIPLAQDELAINGWAMEARLYAEDPAKGFLPSIGMLELFQLPEHIGRVDTGVYEGAEVSPFYDPMIAKVIAWGEDREEARELLSEMLEDSAIWPVKTNSAFLINALGHPDFVAGTVDTGLIGRDGDAMTEEPVPTAQALTNAAMAMVPRSLQSGFRLNAPDVRSAPFLLDGKRVEVELHGPGAEEPSPAMLVAEGGSVWQLTPWRAEASAGVGAGDGAILSPMPGKVIAVEVAAGDKVTKGQKLLTLEAMKMEHSLTAPFDGVVAELNATAGAQVQVEALLARIEAAE
ncbi:MAG: acetyl/propionyl/methylcrotonyl-CoA carboxylase subunit alpha [Sphingopyxis sp.]|uniref:acetyl/propionyl/methylcrotonyl-CoA carboxylase subunit alpha n=1 Tax=Sphingopyxis sp. TaxID=1908224 RepID=UPI0040361553